MQRGAIKTFSLFIALCVVIAFSFITVKSVMKYMYKQYYKTDYAEYVDKYSEQYGIDKYLVYAVIRCESGFQPDAVSSVGARGLMQVTEDTFHWAQFRMDEAGEDQFIDMFDPEVNIKHGVYILKLFLDEFDEQSTAIAAYHAGRGNVNEWLVDDKKSADGINLDNIPIPQTDQYVDKVMKSYELYHLLYTEGEKAK